MIPLTWLRSRGVVALLAIAGCSAACGRGGETESTPEVIAVMVQAARIGSLRDTVSVSGTVVPATVADFVVTADQPAEIAELPHNEGDTVKTGDVLVRLDVPSVTNEVATRQIELNEATSRVEAAKKEENTLESLVAQGLTARNKLEAARAARIAAEANATQVRARFDSAKALEGGTVIRARFPGVVIKRWHAPGEMVASGESDPILRVIDPARLQVAIQVPRAQADRINQGQPATVQTGTALEPAMVSMKGTPASEATPTIDVRLNITSATPLPIDSVVQAEIVLEELHDVLLIPAGAVQRDEKGPFVWVVAATGQATKREIRVGLTITGSTQVLTGLTAGDQVIVTGIAQLSEGVMVTISK